MKIVHYTGYPRDYLVSIHNAVSSAITDKCNPIILWGKPRKPVVAGTTKVTVLSPTFGYEYKLAVEGPIINPVERTRIARSKSLTLRTLRAAGIGVVPFTNSFAQAISWVKDGHSVYARTKTGSFGGRGIFIMTKDNLSSMPTRLSKCTLFTQGIPADTVSEYRVHVGKLPSGTYQVIDATMKKKRNGWREMKTFSDTIRNYHNGWVYCRNKVVIPDVVIEQSIAAVKAVGVDFGAVDIMATDDATYVLEVNTAPGLVSPTTIDQYAEFFKKFMKEYSNGQG